MTKINTENWKEFRVGDLFDVSYGKFIPKKDSTGGNIPHITSSGLNNGIGYYVDKPMFPGNCITVASDGAMGASFYQEKPYSASNIVSSLVPHDNIPLNRTNAQFFCSILRAYAQNYSWETQKFSVDRIRNLFIKLPVTSSGEIDWNYIEKFMASCEGKASNNVERVRRGEAEPHSLVDTSDWGSFKISELFNCYHGQRQKASERIDGDIPLVTAGKENLGIATYISNPLCLYNKAITIDMFGNCFYHNTKCAGDDNVYFFVNDDISEYSKLFITSVISSVLKNKYSYDKQFRQPDADKLIIKLPVTSDGQPDFAYMENYIKNLKKCL